MKESSFLIFVTAHNPLARFDVLLETLRGYQEIPGVKDVFIHIEVLRRSGLADLQPGEAVCLRVIEGKRGRMATEVCAWEAAVKARSA